MKILVDTYIWSMALRRKTEQDVHLVNQLKELILEQKVQMIGPIRQELLSGIRTDTQFMSLKKKLSAFPDLDIKSEDYETAAEFCNINRKKGIQGSNTDFLLCAVSHNYEMPIFTSDKDFLLYEKHLPIVLFQK